MTEARLPCIVPNCRGHAYTRTISTIAGGFVTTEGICARHWRLVPRRWKAVQRRIEADFCGSPFGANIQRTGRIWNRIKRKAVEAAAGIA
jgi:hypothetical protein